VLAEIVPAAGFSGLVVAAVVFPEFAEAFPEFTSDGVMILRMSHPSTIGGGMVNATGSLVPPTMLAELPRRLPGFEPLPKLLPQLLTLKLETLLKLPSDLIGVRYSDVKEFRMYSPRLLLLVPREMT
jgi:hypothetical protein